MPIKSAVSSVGTRYTANEDGTVITDTNGTKYNIEYASDGGGAGECVDTTARQSIGDLSQLETTAKNDLVSAINEIKGQIKSFRIITLSCGERLNVPAKTSTYVQSESTTLNADEIPVGVLKYDGGWGNSPGKTMITAWSLEFFSDTRTVYFRGEVFNNTDESILIGCSGIIVAAKVGV